MAWTDHFPILSEELISDYKSDATRQEKVELEGYFDIKRVFEAHGVRRTGPHLVSTTLFWKNPKFSDPEIPTPSLFRMIHAHRLGIADKVDVWQKYVEPLLHHGAVLRDRLPDVELRVYLASDLDFLVEPLTRAGWCVYLMKSPSIRHAPGSLWRFLALTEKGRIVTMVDCDRIFNVPEDLERSKLMSNTGLGVWRIPGYYRVDIADEVRYRPLLAGNFGALSKLPSLKLLAKAFVWHMRKGSLPKEVLVPGCGTKSLKFFQWPNYGVDEIFLMMAVYPRLARYGTLTFLPTDASSLFVPIDIEYVTWANSRSETVYVPTGTCC